MIFISNFFIRKLNQANHWFIDGTFVYPSDFSQLIVILYRDINNGKNYPGLFALINNKKKEGYKVLFEKIRYILTIENTLNLNLKTYTLDLEIALQKAFFELFPFAKCIDAIIITVEILGKMLKN